MVDSFTLIYDSNPKRHVAVGLKGLEIAAIRDLGWCDLSGKLFFLIIIWCLDFFNNVLKNVAFSSRIPSVGFSNV